MGGDDPFFWDVESVVQHFDSIVSSSTFKENGSDGKEIFWPIEVNHKYFAKRLEGSPLLTCDPRAPKVRS